MANIIKMDNRDRAGLKWLSHWARSNLTKLKVGRKYRPAGNFSDEEMAVLNALIALEKAAKSLLRISKTCAGDTTF